MDNGVREKKRQDKLLSIKSAAGRMIGTNNFSREF